MPAREKRLDELAELLDRYPEQSAHWLYLRALAAYATKGDCPEARELVAAGHRANRHVRKFLLGHEPMSLIMPQFYDPDGEDGAVIAAMDLIECVLSLDGALEWLLSQTKNRPRKRRRRRK